MKKFIPLGLLVLALSAVLFFQNCSGSKHATTSGNNLSLSSIYPYYDEKPLYFENIQLTTAFKENELWKYQFVASVVYIDMPSEEVDVEIRIFDQDQKILCPRRTARVKNTNNHIEIPDCQSSHQATLARIEIYAKLASETAIKKISNYTFVLK
jgi:hypothetical protein